MADRKSLALFLWEKALPFTQGRVRFAPDEMRARWEAAHRNFWGNDVKSMLPSGQSSALEITKAFAAAFKPRQEINKAIDEWVTRQLKSGAIIGLGFEPPRRMNSEPVIIPAACWRNSVRHDSDKLRIDGLIFTETRILPRTAAKQIKAAWEIETVPPHPAPKRGPRGSAMDIAEAFEALHAAGRIDFNASAKSHYPEIRDWLQYHHPKVGYSAAKPTDETIRKTFQPMFDPSRSKR